MESGGDTGFGEKISPSRGATHAESPASSSWIASRRLSQLDIAGRKIAPSAEKAREGGRMVFSLNGIETLGVHGVQSKLSDPGEDECW